MCCTLTFLLFLLSLTAHMFPWIYWRTHMYKCLLTSATVKFKFALLHVHLLSFVLSYVSAHQWQKFPHISWATAQRGLTAERGKLSLRSWCNCLVTPSPALWVIALKSKLWGLEPLVDLHRGPCPQGRTAWSANASCKRPGNLEYSRATNALRFLTVSWAECQVGCLISFHCEAENGLLKVLSQVKTLLFLMFLKLNFVNIWLGWMFGLACLNDLTITVQ